MENVMSFKAFLIIGLTCAIAYKVAGPVGLGVLALFVLLKAK